MSRMIEVLGQQGFERREIAIYLFLVKHRDSTALEISKGAKIDRTTAYDLLEKMIARGIVSSILKNSTRRFNALAPRELIAYFREKFESLESILPDLDRHQEQASMPLTCELFEGTEGLRTVLKDLLNSKKDYRAIGIRKEYEQVLGYFNDLGVIRMDQFKAREIALVENNARFKKLKNGIYRYTKNKLKSRMTMVLYSDIVLFFVWTEPYHAIRIKNAEFAAGQLEYFNIMWAAAKDV
jgi:HTH-type transcriptional regulator, sugar sensing transcriptional regulator